MNKNNCLLGDEYEYKTPKLVYHYLIPIGKLKRYLFIFDLDIKEFHDLVKTIILNDEIFSTIDYMETKLKKINANKEEEYQVLHLCDYYQKEKHYNVKNSKFIDVLLQQPIREDFQNTLIEKWNFSIRRYLKKEEIFFKIKNK